MRLVESFELQKLPELTTTRLRQLAKKYPTALEELNKRMEHKFIESAKKEAFSHTIEGHRLHKLEEALKPKEDRMTKIDKFYAKWDKVGTELEKHSKRAGSVCDNIMKGMGGIK